MSARRSFFAATVRTDGGTLQLSMSKALLESVFGDIGEIESLAVRPLNRSGGSRWLLTGFLHSRSGASQPTEHQEASPKHTPFDFDL